LDYSLLSDCRVLCFAPDSCKITIKTTPRLKYKYIGKVAADRPNTIREHYIFSHVDKANLPFSQFPIVGLALLRYRRKQCVHPRQPVEEITPEPLPEMVPLHIFPPSQRQLFGLSLNGRPELDLMVKNPVKRRKLVTLSPTRRTARTSTGSLMDAMKRKAVLEGLVDVVAELEDTHNVRVIDTERTNLERKHALLPLDQLIGLLDSCFVSKGYYLHGSHTIEKVSVGIVTSLNVFFSTVGCGAGGSIKAPVCKNGIRVKQDEWKARRYDPASKVATKAFHLYMRLVLAMQ
jgi:hypothetical protein